MPLKVPSPVQMSARLTLVHPDNKLLCARYAKHSKQRSLLAMAVGREGGPSLKVVLKYFSNNVFDVIFFHWDKLDNRKDWVERYPWAFAVNMKHIFDPGKFKQDYGRIYLTPELACKYEYIFFWDDDAVIPTDGVTGHTFSGTKFVRMLRDNDVDLAGPTFTSDSLVSYDQSYKKKHPATAIEESPLVVEIGFQVWKSSAWLVAHAVLQRFPMKIWYFDALPWKCIGSLSGIRNVGLVHDLPIRHVRKSDESRLNLDHTMIKEDLRYRNEAIETFGCCMYLQKLKIDGKISTKGYGIELLDCDLKFPQYLLRKR